MADGASDVIGLEVGIIVRDLEAVTPFYQEGLGLEHLLTRELPVGIQRRFACGDGGIVKLMQPAESPTAANPPGGITGGATGLRWFTLKVADLEAVLARCEAAGGKVTQPIIEPLPGVKMMVIEDPEGNCAVEVALRRD